MSCGESFEAMRVERVQMDQIAHIPGELSKRRESDAGGKGDDLGGYPGPDSYWVLSEWTAQRARMRTTVPPPIGARRVPASRPKPLGEWTAEQADSFGCVNSRNSALDGVGNLLATEGVPRWVSEQVCF